MILLLNTARKSDCGGHTCKRCMSVACKDNSSEGKLNITQMKTVNKNIFNKININY